MGAMIPECAVACVIGPCCADTATHCDRLTASAVPTHRSGGAAADARGPPESRSPRTAQRKIALQCRLQTARFASSALVQGARCGLNRAGTDVAFVEDRGGSAAEVGYHARQSKGVRVDLGLPRLPSDQQQQRRRLLALRPRAQTPRAPGTPPLTRRLSSAPALERVAPGSDEQRVAVPGRSGPPAAG